MELVQKIVETARGTDFRGALTIDSKGDDIFPYVLHIYILNSKYN